MTRTVVVANQNGGVGKSTVVMNLGIALAERKRRVLLIDLDPQGALSALFGLSAYDVRRSVYSLLMYDHIGLARVMRPLRRTVALVPTSIDLASAEVVLARAPQRVTRLREALTGSRVPFDWVIIDTPPNLGVLTASGLVAASEVLIPVRCQFPALRSVHTLLDTVQRVREALNPGLRLLGLFVNMYRPDSLSHQEQEAALRAVFGDQMLQTVVSYDDAITEAPVAGLAALEYATDQPVAQSFRDLAEEIINERLNDRRPTASLSRW